MAFFIFLLIVIAGLYVCICVCMCMYVYIHIYTHVYIHIYIFLYITCSVHINLYVCLQSWSFVMGQPISVLFSGEGYLSCPQLSSVTCNFSCGVEASWVFLCPVCHIYWCHPCPARIWQSWWWGFMGASSDVSRWHSLTANSLIFLLFQFFCPLRQCSLSLWVGGSIFKCIYWDGRL